MNTNFSGSIGENLQTHKIVVRDEVILFLGTLIVNIIPIFYMGLPIITDEYTTMAEGLYLWKAADWSSYFKNFLNLYFGYGTNILYGFFYYFTDNVQYVYKIALVINSLLLSFVPVMAFSIAKRRLNIETKISFLIAFAVSLFPAGIIHAKYALNETMLTFLGWLIFYIAFKIFDSESSFKEELFLFSALGFLGSYSYAVHGRGIVLLLVSTLFCLYMAIKRKKLQTCICVLTFFIVAAAVHCVDSSVRKYILNTFIGNAHPEAQINTLSRSFHKLLMVFDPQNLKSFICGLLGQAYYLTCCTYGLFAMIIMTFVISLKEQIQNYGTCKKDGIIFSQLFIGITVIATLLVSTIFLIEIYIQNEAHAGEYFIYGRYNESVCGLLLFAVFAFIVKRKEQLSSLFISIFIVIYLALILWGNFVTAQNVIKSSNYISYTMASGIMPYFGINAWNNASQLNFIFLSGNISLIASILFIFLFKNKTTYALFFIITCFLYSSIFSLYYFVIPQSQLRRDRMAPLSVLAQKMPLPVNYNAYVTNFPGTPKPRVQFVLNKLALRHLKLEQNGFDRLASVPLGSIIISEKDYYFDYMFDDMYMIEPDSLYDPAGSLIDKFYVYIFGKDLKKRFQDQGFKISDRSFKSLYGVEDEYPAADAHKIQEEFLFSPGVSFSLHLGNLPPFSYKLNLSGEKLKSLFIESQSNAIANLSQVSVHDQSMSYTFESRQGNSSADLTFKNGSMNDSGYIQAATLYPLKMKITDAKKILPSHRSLMYGATDSPGSQFYRARIVPAQNLLPGQNSITLFPDSRLTFPGLIFNPGTYELRILGTHVDHASIKLMKEDKSALKTECVLSTSEQLSLIVSTEEYLRNVYFSMTNGKDKVLPITYEGLEINRVDVPTLICRFGESFAFNSDSNLGGMQRFGWSGPEPWGTWGMGQEQSIVLGAEPKSATGLELIIRATAYHADKTVTFSINGEEIGTQIIKTGVVKDYTMMIPQKLLKNANKLTIRMHSAEESTSPRENGESADGRKLNIGLLNFTFREAVHQ